jgi:hypothetical protein
MYNIKNVEKKHSLPFFFSSDMKSKKKISSPFRYEGKNKTALKLLKQKLVYYIVKRNLKVPAQLVWNNLSHFSPFFSCVLVV